MTTPLERLREENDVLRERIRQLEAVLGVKRTGPVLPGLSNTEDRILTLLMAAPDICSHERLMVGLYGHRYEDSPEGNTVKVFVSKLRRKLPGVKIETHWGLGYRLAPETKAMIRQLIEDNTK